MSRRKRITVAAIAGLLAFLFGFLSTIRSAPAQPRPESQNLNVRNEFLAGFAGDTQALDRGMNACEKVLASDPKRVDALVWHGGGLLFEAGAAFRSGDQQKGVDLWTRGLNEMQTALSLQPDNAAIRISAAALIENSRFLPSTSSNQPDAATSR